MIFFFSDIIFMTTEHFPQYCLFFKDSFEILNLDDSLWTFCTIYKIKLQNSNNADQLQPWVIKDILDYFRKNGWNINIITTSNI